MKKKIIILAAISTLTIFGSCTGNTAKNPPDTNGNSVNTPNSTDTSKITDTTGDVPNVDNSGSGGASIDTSRTNK